jgi:galactokinase
MTKEILAQKFNDHFGKDDNLRFFFSPGRVNLIGEHIDYNGGDVFPCALDIGTYAVARKRGDNIISFASDNFPLRASLAADDIRYDAALDWINYPAGVAAVMRDQGAQAGGMDILFYGDLPAGAGLSSSASIELAMAVAINEMYACGWSAIDLVKAAQRAENEFVGVNCGIMDQFAIGVCRKDHALLLNCSTLACEHVPLNLAGYTLAIVNTNKKRQLADSKYNERRSECDRALAKLQGVFKIENLASLPMTALDEAARVLDDAKLLCRTCHVVTEQNRVRRAVTALKENRIDDFALLLQQSHISLCDDYEVTGRELDILAESAWEQGIVGARMTGAGFGGCAVMVVPDDLFERGMPAVMQTYKEKSGLDASVFRVRTGAGASEF